MLAWAGGLALAALAGSEAPATFDPVVVTANPSAQPASQLPYGVGVVDNATIVSAGPGVSIAESLSRVPGLSAFSRNNYAQDVQLSARGYGTRASFGVRGLRIYEDGIPATAPDGQGQVSQLDLANVERIEVLRGPFSTLYGNASGGVIALFDRDITRDAARTEADVGSFGLRQYRAAGDVVFGEQWSARASGSRMDIEGFRPHSGAARQLYSAQLNRHGTDDTLALTASYWEQPAQDPLGLTRIQFDADPRQTTIQALQFDTRKNAHQAQVGARWASGGLAISYYGGTRSVTQWLSIPISAQTGSTSHPGGVVDFDRHYTGFDARYSIRLSDIDVTAGLAGDLQVEDRHGYNNFTGPGPQCTSPGTQCGVTGALRRDEENRAQDFDEYLQAIWRFAPGASATLGVRHGAIVFRSDDHYIVAGNGDDSGVRHYGYTDPVLGLAFQPDAHWSLRASAARGYETPTLNELAYGLGGSGGFNTGLQAQSSRQLELGATWRVASGFVDFALFDARSRNELVVLTNSGGRSTFGNAGRTDRHGAELATQWHVARQWSTHAALTWLDARYRDAFLTCTGGGTSCTTPSVLVPARNLLPGTPRALSFLDVAWEPAPFAVALEWQARSRVAVNDVNSDFAAGFGLLALRSDYTLPLGGAQLRLGARVDNLLNRTCAGSVIVNEGNSRYFETGSPRALLLTLALAPY